MWMVRLVDRSGAPCALHLAVRDATGEPIVELQADSPEWWEFGVVTVIRTPDLRFCGTQFPSVAIAMGELQSYLPPMAPTASRAASFEQLEAYVAPHVTGALKKELVGDHSFSHPHAGGWATQRHSPNLAAVSVSCSRGWTAHDDALGYEWYPASVLRPFVPHEMTDAGDVELKVRELMSQDQHKVTTRRWPRQRREKGEIYEGPKEGRAAPELEIRPVTEHMDGRGWAGEPHLAPHLAAERQPPSRKRKRFLDREGIVLFLRPGALDGWESAASPATAVVVVGKRMGRPLIPGGSPRYVIARPLAGGPQEEWHVSQLEPTGERLPGLYRAFREAEEPQRETLRVLIARVIREMHRSSTVSIEQMFEQSVPGGVWSEVARGETAKGREEQEQGKECPAL